MAWSKLEIVNEAFAELGLASYDFDLTPEELQSGVRRLDTLMASWVAQDINLGYAFGLSPGDTDLQQDSGLPLFAVEAVYLALAIRLASSKGKQVAATTCTAAKAAYDAMLVSLAGDNTLQTQARTGTPAGAGNRRCFRPYLSSPNTDPLQVDGGGNLEFLGT